MRGNLFVSRKGKLESRGVVTFPRPLPFYSLFSSSVKLSLGFVFPERKVVLSNVKILFHSASFSPRSSFRRANLLGSFSHLKKGR